MTAELAKRLAPEYSRVLSAIFEFMLNGGMQREDVLSISARSLQSAEARAHRASQATSGDLATAALVLDAWHRNHRYLDAAAIPRAVRLLGPAPSVEALIRAQRGRKGSADLAERLKALRLVIPCGKGLYKPTSDVALVSAQDQFTLQHMARSLLMLLETIGQNLNNDPKTGRLLERFAEVPDLPFEELSAFQEFTKAQGWILLRTVNDWLESRRAQRRSRGGRRIVRAGIHVHAYVATADDRHSSAKE